MIPIKTIVIEQVRRDISSVKQAYVKLACNRVISPGISHIACESVETAIRTFMFGCLFSIHCLGMCDTKGSTCLLWDITTEKSGLCCYAVRITQNTYVKK